MSGRRRLQFRLGRIMVVVVLVAMILAASRNRWLALGTLIAFFVCVIGVVTAGSLELLLGVRCPDCGSWGMQRMGLRPFGLQYYRCPACGVRRKRPMAGWRWADASSPEDGRWYHSRPPAHPWVGDPEGVPDEGSLSGMTGDLVRNQRRRRRPDSDEPR